MGGYHEHLVMQQRARTKPKFVILYRIAHGPVRYWTCEAAGIGTATGLFHLSPATSEAAEVLACFNLAAFLQAMRMLPLESFARIFPGADVLAIKEALITAGEKCE